MKRALQIGNIIAFVATVLVNYASNTGAINNTTIGAVSESLTTLFTPAGYAFAIWGVIYLLLFGFIVYQSRSLFTTVRDDAFILKTGWWFVLSCIANCLWVIFWLYGYINFSVLCIFVLLYSLSRIVLNNDMELWDAPISVIAFLWWPFVIYSGWVTVASIANVSAYLVKIGWEGFGFAESTWAMIMICIGGCINLWVTWSRNMREFALVGVWALAAIAVANWGAHEEVSYTAILVATVLFGSSSIHGFKNRDTSPIIKYSQYRKRS
ncbi:tryptophan-rich sensory protein [Altibacter sp.]|uniref:tryptophan-rich sensory protein n=1 Tax=Altibacter sp. TaxID=2024823 RepID=UPI00258F4952|nr:tryptophan-rich sensory protein [Altibacter sp.]MCW9036596.1 tryptophan-rich sensory protein [Altibacter sp.]